MQNQKQIENIKKTTAKIAKKEAKNALKRAKKIKKAEKANLENFQKVQTKFAKKQAKLEYKRLPKKEKKVLKLKQKARKKAVRNKAKQIRRAKEPSFKPLYTNRIDADELLNMESQWGGILFGPVPAGHQRSFFEYKKNVWIWYEGWPNKKGGIESTTIRYEVRPSGVFKRVNDRKYEKISGVELDYFRMTLHQYLNLMKTKLYY